jgi:hypothetical protein
MSASPSLSTSAVKVVGVPRKLFQESATKTPAKRKHLPEEVDKENTANANDYPSSGGAHPTRKRDQRLKKLKSSKNLTNRTLIPKAHSTAVPLPAPSQGVALPLPLALEGGEAVDQDACQVSSEETLMMLTDIMTRKRRPGPAETPGSLRPPKKARSLCGAEAAKLIRRRPALADGVIAEERATQGAANDSRHPTTSSHHTLSKGGRQHTRRTSFDGSTLWLARWRQQEGIGMEAKAAATTGMSTAVHSTSSVLVMPLPLWRDIRRKPAAAAAAASSSLATSATASPSQAEKRRRRSRSVGDLKQLMAVSDEAATTVQASTLPKKRERRRKRNSLVRAIDKLISVAGINGTAPRSHARSTTAR